jgi:hypothetical protein
MSVSFASPHRPHRSSSSRHEPNKSRRRRHRVHDSSSDSDSSAEDDDEEGEEDRRHRKRRKDGKAEKQRTRKKKPHKVTGIETTDNDEDDLGEEYADATKKEKADERRRRKKIDALARDKRSRSRHQDDLELSVAIKALEISKKEEAAKERRKAMFEKGRKITELTQRANDTEEYIEHEKGLFDDDSELVAELEKLSIYHSRRHKEWQRQAYIGSRVELEVEGQELVCEGDHRLKKIYEILDSLPYKRTEVQIMVHDRCIEACLPKIYGVDDFDANIERLLEEFGLKKIDPRVLSLQPRRYGKTFAVAMFCVALLLSVPGIVIVVFSTGGRISSKLMETVLQMVSSIPGAKQRIVHQTKEDLFISVSELDIGQGKQSEAAKGMRIDATTSKLFSYPNNAQGLRGTGGDVIILEEAAYIDPELFQKVIVPLMMMRHTAVIGISSPSDENNYASILAEVKTPDGEFVFLTISVGLFCEECKKNPTGERCPHIRQRLPDHRSAKGLIVAEALIQNEQDRNQELHGIIGAKQHLFQRWMPQFEKRDPFHIRESVELIHSYIDPAANGDASDFVVCSGAHLQGKTVIVGLDEFESVTSNLEGFDGPIAMMYEHYDALLRKHRDALVWIYIESNLNGPLAAHWGHLLERKYGKRVVLERLDPKDVSNIGVKTTNDEKQLWATCMVSLLSSGNLVFANDMVGRNVDKSKQKIWRQLRHYTRVVKEANDPEFGVPKWTYTGKGGGQKDDVACALQGMGYNMFRQQSTPAFYDRCEALGIHKVS